MKDKLERPREKKLKHETPNWADEFSKGYNQALKEMNAWIDGCDIESCPCKHIEPCCPECTCVNPYSSRGCMRCCTYGSKEQQIKMANIIATAIRKALKGGEGG